MSQQAATPIRPVSSTEARADAELPISTIITLRKTLDVVAPLKRKKILQKSLHLGIMTIRVLSNKLCGHLKENAFN